MKLAILGTLLAPIAGLLLALLVPGARAAARLSAAASLALLALALVLASGIVSTGSLSWPGARLHVDALSILVLLLASLLVAIAASEPTGLETPGTGADAAPDADVRRHHAHLHLLALAVAVALLTDHQGVLCLGAFLAVLAAALLVAGARAPAPAPAGLTLLLGGGLGIAVATLGAALFAASAPGGASGPVNSMLLTGLSASATDLDPDLVRAAFPLILFGFGILAGLGPLHVWLPPVSRTSSGAVTALVSGVLLNLGLYGILRYRAIATIALGEDLPGRMLEALGFLSAVLAVPLLLSAHDLRRRVAYASVGQTGIAAFGLGIGGPAAVGALLHVVGHTLARSLVLLEGAPRPRSQAQREDPEEGLGSGSLAAALAAVGALALAGIPPSAVFTGQFVVFSSGFALGRERGTAILLVCAAVSAAALCVPVARRLRIEAAPATGSPGTAVTDGRAAAGPRRRNALLVALALVIVGLGIAVPAPLGALLRAAGVAAEPVSAPPALGAPRRLRPPPPGPETFPEEPQ